MPVWFSTFFFPLIPFLFITRFPNHLPLLLWFVACEAAFPARSGSFSWLLIQPFRFCPVLSPFYVVPSLFHTLLIIPHSQVFAFVPPYVSISFLCMLSLSYLHMPPLSIVCDSTSLWDFRLCPLSPSHQLFMCIFHFSFLCTTKALPI